MTFFMAVSVAELVNVQGEASLVIVVETVARDRLPATAWAWLKVAANLMQIAAWDTAVIACRKVQVIVTGAIGHPVKLP